MNKFILILFFVTITALGQNSSNANVPITITLIKGLSTAITSGNLNYGDVILNGSSTLLNKNPQEGVVVRIAGHPNQFINFSFDQLELNNSVDNPLIQNNQLQFNPTLMQTGASSVYTNPVEVTVGSSHKLQQEDENGLLYVWIGGEIQIADNQSAGNYSGVFQLTVSY